MEVKIDVDALIVSMWNKYVDGKIHLNDKEFFTDSFENSYDAAWSVSIGDWRRTDEYVCFNDGGYLVSFNHWDDENSPIDIARLSTWLQNKNKNKKGYVKNIPRAIHDALQEV